MDKQVNSLDSELRHRAKKVVPGGMWGHMNAAALPEGYPQFFARGSGSRLWDVEAVGVRPDLSGWSKSIANGFALAAVTGNERFRDATSKLFTTGSFWCSAVSMAAAVATLTALRRDDAIGHMERLGGMLRDGLGSLSKTHGLPIRQTGPVQMPMVLFEDDPDNRKGFAFCLAMVKRGIYFHPLHNMFLSAAHTTNDIERALDAAEHGFRESKRA